MTLEQLQEAHLKGVQHTQLGERISMLRRGMKDGPRGLRFIFTGDDCRAIEYKTGGDNDADAMGAAVDAYLEVIEAQQQEIAHDLAKLGIDVTPNEDDHGGASLL